MRKYPSVLLTVAALLFGPGNGPARAFEAGIFDQARAGCTCHGGVVPTNTTTQLIVDGLPEQGYVPGESYELTIYVLGTGLPIGLTLFENRAGFNLQATSGRLNPRAGDETIQTQNRSECTILKDLRNCNPETTCGVKTNGPDGATLCTNNFDCLTRFCNSPGTADCRSCSAQIIDVQAAHTASGGVAAGTPARLFADGNSLMIWQMIWTAPPAGTGDVRFDLAGNAVNGNRVADPGDLWSTLDAPVVVPEAAP